MKPVRLELRGFTAFREPAVVNFEGRQLFAITGPTGAGKSSLLDAITWALYGRVSRVGNETKQLLSHGAQAMAVRFDFRARGQTYRVSRQAGKTSAMRLEREVAPDRWEPVADKAHDVSTEVEHIIGLDYATFTKTVLLPQGAFDAFLRGEPRERRDILTSLLGLGIYDEMRSGAYARASGARSLANVQREQAEGLALASPEAMAALEAERVTTEARLQAVAAQRAALSELVDLERTASDRTRDAATAAAAARAAAGVATEAEAALAAATQAAEQAAAQLDTLKRERAELQYDAEEHKRLEQQAASLRQYEHARADVVQAQQALTAAQRAAKQARETAAVASRSALRQRKAADDACATLERAHAGLAAIVGPALAATTALAAQIGAAEDERAQAASRSDEYEQKARTLQALAKQFAELRSEHAAADTEAAKATAAAATAEAERIRAEGIESAAATALDHAAEQRETARRENAAAAVRRGLAIGDECPVCGELITSLAEHDAPDLDAAEGTLQSAQQALDRARKAHQQQANSAATAYARAEAARATLAAIDAKFTALDAQCAEAGVTRAGIDRAAKRASTAAAAEGERANAAAQRATEATALQRELELLLARVPENIKPTEATLPRGSLTAALNAALDAHASASAAVREAENIARAADEASRAAEADAMHAADREAHATEAVTGAQARLDALGAIAGGSEATLTALAEAERRAQRAQAIDEVMRAAAQECAGAASRIEERSGAHAHALDVAALASAACTAAEAAAAIAVQTYAERWRDLPGIAVAPNATALASMSTRLDTEARDAGRMFGAIGARLETAERERVEAERLRAESSVSAQRAQVAGELEQELHKNRFVAYVQREAMQILATEAGERIEQLSRGRYRMRAEDDEFVVVDRFNGDEQRSVKTLSGGETFLASLALALALAERLPQLAGHGGALSLESLFLDEGFGTLDADALDVAIEALELLASGDRMIGVISHVPLIAERLPDRIEVVKVGATSTVRC